MPKGLWHFPDGHDVLIVCGRLHDAFTGLSTEPADPDYLELYTFADLDALIEVFGHIRATNPGDEVRFKTVDKLAPDDYTKHLVLLGGVD